MDTLTNVRTFVIAARLGSFAGAARSLATAPSVVSKRIVQLEHEFKAVLFHRSTREMTLTKEGARLLPRCLDLIAAFDDLHDRQPGEAVSGHIRVHAPGTVTSMVLRPIFCDFLAAHPDVDMDLRLIDRLDDPLIEGADLAIGTRPAAYENVIDTPLMPYPCATYASPTYLRHHGTPDHPSALAGHSCLVSRLIGTVWNYYSDAGDMAVSVRPRLSVNDGLVLRDATCMGLGIAVLPMLLAQQDVSEDRLQPLFPRYRPPPLWLRALVPNTKMAKPAVSALLAFLRQRLAASRGPHDPSTDARLLRESGG
jgi:DNA-binding transcriptional LysR family regulator